MQININKGVGEQPFGFGPRIKRHGEIAKELSRSELESALRGYNSMSKSINPDKPPPVNIAALSEMPIEKLRILYAELTSYVDL